MRFLFSFFLLTTLYAEPEAIYLTWIDDPLTTVTINWITRKDDVEDTIFLYEVGKDVAYEYQGMHKPLPHKSPHLQHIVHLVNLKPGTDYAFYLQDKAYKFRTAPQTDEKPVVFIEGGDVYHDEIETVEQMNREGAKQNPLFGVIGGDIAYARMSFGWQASHMRRWLTWLRAWSDTMVTPDGYLIPIVAVIGNHDTEKGYHDSPKNAQAYYQLLDPYGYRVMDFGKYLSLILLDSNHTHSFREQKDWLEDTLTARKDIKNKFAVYHVPAYPSHRKFNNKRCEDVRRNWSPVFEKHEVPFAFEHHDHCYKRTYPIKGVTYVGDGAWGVKPRDPEEREYLAKAKKSRALNVVTIHNNTVKIKVIDDAGEIIDEF